MYRTKTEGSFPENIEIMGKHWTKVEDLRYGTNPHHQRVYRPVESEGFFGCLSNIEDR
jgi:AICAR transformylase/IMP cyclohydrolase PurH